MKKYIVITALVVGNIAWPMDKKHSPETTHSNNPETLFQSFQTIDDKKKGWQAIDTINQNAATQKTNPVAANWSKSRLFVHSSKL